MNWDLELRGELRAGHPLFVVALPQEAAHLCADLPVLITGVGKVRAAVAVSQVMALARVRGTVPSGLINLGTAGGLHPGMAGIYEASSVFQSDYNDAALFAMTSRHDGPTIDLSGQPGFEGGCLVSFLPDAAPGTSSATTPTSADGAKVPDRGAPSQTIVLATGDHFIAGGAERERLMRTADLVDMEGYAVAAAAAAAGVPVRLIKLVSDPAEEGADLTWQEGLDVCAERLAAWARTHVSLGK